MYHFLAHLMAPIVLRVRFEYESKKSSCKISPCSKNSSEISLTKIIVYLEVKLIYSYKFMFVRSWTRALDQLTNRYEMLQTDGKFTGGQSIID